MKVLVCDYDPQWTRDFETLRDRIWPAVQDFAVAVEHVGSTAVPGLAAKPIIDVDVIVPSGEDVRRRSSDSRPSVTPIKGIWASRAAKPFAPP